MYIYRQREGQADIRAGREIYKKREADNQKGRQRYADRFVSL